MDDPNYIVAKIMAWVLCTVIGIFLTVIGFGESEPQRTYERDADYNHRVKIARFQRVVGIVLLAPVIFKALILILMD